MPADNVQPKRPKPGTVTSRQIEVRVCKACGYAMNDTGLCSDICDLDGTPHPPEQIITAVYIRTDVFIGDKTNV